MKKILILAASIALSVGCGCQNEKVDDWCSPRKVLGRIPAPYRSEMEKVLKHYDNDADSLKYKAALYLIYHMPGHHSFYGTAVDEYHRRLDSVISSIPIVDYRWDAQKLSDAVAKLSKEYPVEEFDIKEDYEILTADFLIDNIEEAFDMWKNGKWARHLEFDDFCEYVLPYRISEMYVPEKNWRKTIESQIDSTVMCKLETFENSSMMAHSAFWACDLLNSDLLDRIDRYNISRTSPNVWMMSLRARIPCGKCQDFSDRTALFMRSIGIPASIEFTPQWASRAMGHMWNSVLMNNGRYKPFNGGNTEMEPYHVAEEEKMAKVYRVSYSANKDIEKIISKEQYSPFLNVFGPFLKDVTDEYMRTSDVTVKAKSRPSGTCYLAVYDNQQWVPVCPGKKSGWKKYVFEDVGRGIAYLPVYYSEVGIRAFADPFILEENGDIHILTPSSDEFESADLERKFALARRIHQYVSRMIGGKFQASNNPDFKDAETVYEIRRWSVLPDSAIVNPSKPYRYWRYLSPDGSFGNISEIEFYEAGGNHPLRGTVFGTDADKPDTDKDVAFDGDPLTFYHVNPPIGLKNVFVGMDFGRPTVISKIRYQARTDDNDVCPGDKYELLYWKGEMWVSLERHTAKGHTLHYDDIPKNSLLLLKDLTRGKEVRIFTLKDGKQIWW